MRLLFRILVREFYTIHAGYFLFCFILFFGIVSPADLVFYHTSIILGMFSAPLFIMAVMVLWFFYNIQCILFSARVINKPEHIFLTNLQQFSFARQFALFFAQHFFLYLPVFVYTCFVVAMAFTHQYIALAWMLIGYQLINCIIAALALYYQVNTTWTKNKISIGSIPGNISYPLYLLAYTASKKKITFFGIKLFSLFILYVLFVLNKDDFNLISFIAAFLILIMAHAILPFYYIGFFERNLSFYRNLPIARLKTALIYCITYGVVLLPELVFLLVNALHHISLTDIFLLYLVALVNLLLFTAILYMEDIRVKKYIKIIFVVFFVSIFMLNLKNYILLIAADLLIAAVIFINSYHQYEIKPAR